MTDKAIDITLQEVKEAIETWLNEELPEIDRYTVEKLKERLKT